MTFKDIQNLMGLDFNQSPALLLAPLKKQIEDVLKKPVDQYTVEMNSVTSEFIIRADGKQDVKKDESAVWLITKAIKLKLGKKAPNFTVCTMYYDNGKIKMAMKLKDGSIKTEML